LSRGRDEEAGFASRWSRLKRGAAVEDVAPGEVPAAAEDAELAELSDAEALERLGLPDPDTLKPGDDFAAFMAKAVPARLRTRALRKLWLSNPVLANLDMLVDYGEDFTDSAKVVESVQTIYQVGRGMVDKLAADEPEPELPSDDEPAAIPPTDEAGAEPEVGSEDIDPPRVEAEWPAPRARSAPSLRARTRMRFRVSEDEG